MKEELEDCKLIQNETEAYCPLCDKKFKVFKETTGFTYIISQNYEIWYCPYCRPDTQQHYHGRGIK